MGTPRLRFPRAYRHAPGHPAQLPVSAAAEAIAENIRERCGQLAELEPHAVNLAAIVLAALHEGCRGRMTELRGTHSPEYRRRQLLGRDGLQVEGLCYLAVNAPEAVAAALQPLMMQIGYRLDPVEPEEAASVPVELAHLVRSSSEVVAGLTTRLEDGLSAEEACEADALVHDLKTEIAKLEAAVHAVAFGECTP